MALFAGVQVGFAPAFWRRRRVHGSARRRRRELRAAAIAPVQRANRQKSAATSGRRAPQQSGRQAQERANDAPRHPHPPRRLGGRRRDAPDHRRLPHVPRLRGPRARRARLGRLLQGRARRRGRRPLPTGAAAQRRDVQRLPAVDGRGERVRRAHPRRPLVRRRGRPLLRRPVRDGGPVDLPELPHELRVERRGRPRRDGGARRLHRRHRRLPRADDPRQLHRPHLRGARQHGRADGVRADRGPRRRLLPRALPRAGAQLHRLVQRAPGHRRGRQRVRLRALQRVGLARRLRVPRRDDPQRDGGARAVHEVLPRHRRPPDARLPRRVPRPR